MGATSWHYITPYQPDPEAALQRLRTEVFAQGSYVNLGGSPQTYIRRLYEQAGLGADSPECRAAIEQALREQRALETDSEEDLRAVPRARRASLKRARGLMDLFGQAPPRTSGRPRTIDELLAQAAECGTHSILDIMGVAERRKDGAAAPLSASELQRVFGSPEPTRGQVEEHWEDIAEGLERWQACYFVVFQDGQAQAYAFIGCSGD
jgi:hypothetical protein